MSYPRLFRQFRSFRARLLTSFILLSLIPLFSLAVVAYRVSYRIIARNTTANAEMIIDRVRYEVDTLISESLLVADSIGNNGIIQKALEGTFNPDDEQSGLNSRAGEELLDIFRYREELYGIAVVGENGRSMISTVRSADRETRQEDFRSRYWYRQALQDPRPPLYYPPHQGSFVFTEEEESFFSLTIPVEDRLSGVRTGVVIIEILESRLKEILHLRLQESGYLFIQYGRAGFTSSQEDPPDSEYLVRLANKRAIDPELLQQKKEIVLVRDLSLVDLQLVSVISLVELTRDSRQVGLVLIALIAASLLFSILTAILLSRSIARPVQDMRGLMKQVETGDLTVRTKGTGPDEIGDLGRSFNRMVERIDSLVKNVQEDQVMLRKAELRTLQNQINPHFLYNTLDSINWLSRQGRNEDVITLVKGLTSLFRIGISRGKDIITLEEELEHVQSYLIIQSVRYENRFFFDRDVDESLLSCLTLKLILQPLVENALYHGIKEKGGKGRISLRGRRVGSFIILEIGDNGQGMTGERLEEVRSVLALPPGEKDETLYGLKNVNDRIKIYYGESYGLTLHSLPGEGTTVTVKIPAKEV